MIDRMAIDAPTCPSCGGPLVNDVCADCERQLAGLIQREAVVLALLVVITIVTFFLTRIAAAHERASAERAAAAWFEAGQQAQEQGHHDAAITDLRHAAMNASQSVRYQLSLAEALATGDRGDEARRILVRLRESTPDNAEINLALARLAARRDDVPEAVRFYHHALYGAWNGTVIDPVRERGLRTELIEFLLDHGLRSQALSQTLLLEQDLPDEPSAHVETGRLFMRTGSTSNALTHFERALALDPRNRLAKAGATEAAFAAGDYGRAGRFLNQLRSAGELPPELAGVASTLDIILNGDPLVPRLSGAERSRRLTNALNRAIERASSCRPTSELGVMLGEARTRLSAISPVSISRNRELTETTFDLIVHLENLSQACAGEQPIDRALVLLGQKYADPTQ